MKWSACNRSWTVTVATVTAIIAEDGTRETIPDGFTMEYDPDSFTGTAAGGIDEDNSV